MKKLTYLLSAGVLVAMFAVVGCKKDDGGGPSADDVAGANFEGTWVVDDSQDCQVVFDACASGDRTSTYSNFSLTVTYASGQGAGTFTTTGPTEANPWPTSGEWEFSSDSPGENSFTVVRDPGTNAEQNMEVTISETTMTVRFDYTEPSTSGRLAAVEGSWEFNLQLQ